jgi:hypothetical protein
VLVVVMTVVQVLVVVHAPRICSVGGGLGSGRGWRSEVVGLSRGCKGWMFHVCWDMCKTRAGGGFQGVGRCNRRRRRRPRTTLAVRAAEQEAGYRLSGQERVSLRDLGTIKTEVLRSHDMAVSARRREERRTPPQSSGREPWEPFEHSFQPET